MSSRNFRWNTREIRSVRISRKETQKPRGTHPTMGGGTNGICSGEQCEPFESAKQESGIVMTMQPWRAFLPPWKESVPIDDLAQNRKHDRRSLSTLRFGTIAKDYIHRWAIWARCNSSNFLDINRVHFLRASPMKCIVAVARAREICP